MELIETIRNEIKRRYKEFDGKTGDIATASRLAYLDVLSFLDTLEEPEQTCKTCGFYENNCPYIRGKFVPYPNKVCKDYTYSVVKAEQEPDVKPDEELKNASEEYADKHGFRVPYDGSDNFYDDIDVKASREGFLAGAEWMAKQGVTFTAAVDHYEDFYLDSCDQEAEAIKKLGLKVMDWAIVQIRKK